MTDMKGKVALFKGLEGRDSRYHWSAEPGHFIRFHPWPEP